MAAGVLAGATKGRWPDQVIRVVGLFGYSVPVFWLGLIGLFVFYGKLSWVAGTGRLDVFYQGVVTNRTGVILIDAAIEGNWEIFANAFSHLILPAVVLGTIPMAVIARQTRSAMLEVLNEDYVRTARAKGLPPWRIIGLHALRNALIPVVTVIGLQVSVAFGGAILTETIFSWPGVGKWLVDSIARRDYPSVQGGVLLIATIIMLVNLFVDLLYGVINPRIRHAR